MKCAEDIMERSYFTQILRGESSILRDLEEFFDRKLDFDLLQTCCYNKLLEAFQKTKFAETDIFSVKNSLEELEWVRLFVWEHLNTGHWRDVDQRWSKLYSITHLLKVTTLINLVVCKSCPLAQLKLEDFVGDLVKICDIGILMGAPLRHSALDKLASKLSALYQEIKETNEAKKMKVLHDESPSLQVKVPWSQNQLISSVRSVNDLGLEDFLTGYKASETPVCVKMMMEHWPAMQPGSSRWSIDKFLSVAGLRLVPVEIGSRYTDDSWTQTLMTVREFVERFMGRSSAKPGEKMGYLAQHNLLDQVSELREDVDVPYYCYTEESDDEPDINAWFGPAATVSPLHTDPKHNFLCQVFGRKYVRLYQNSQSNKLYPFEGMMLSNTSQVDLEKPDHEKFPLFKDAVGFECILNPGEMLYIPPKCWHFVKALDPSCSVSFWF